MKRSAHAPTAEQGDIETGLALLALPVVLLLFALGGGTLLEVPLWALALGLSLGLLGGIAGHLWAGAVARSPAEPWTRYRQAWERLAPSPTWGRARALQRQVERALADLAALSQTLDRVRRDPVLVRETVRLRERPPRSPAEAAYHQALRDLETWTTDLQRRLDEAAALIGRCYAASQVLRWADHPAYWRLPALLEQLRQAAHDLEEAARHLRAGPFPADDAHS